MEKRSLRGGGDWEGEELGGGGEFGGEGRGGWGSLEENGGVRGKIR